MQKKHLICFNEICVKQIVSDIFTFPCNILPCENTAVSQSNGHCPTWLCMLIGCDRHGKGLLVNYTWNGHLGPSILSWYVMWPWSVLVIVIAARLNLGCLCHHEVLGIRENCREQASMSYRETWCILTFYDSTFYSVGWKDIRPS